MATKRTTKVITIASNKGGVGKSATAGCFSHLLGKRGYRVLLIDTDSQGDVSADFGMNEETIDENRRLSTAVLAYCNPISAAPLSEYICHTRYSNVDILPGDESLARTRIPVSEAMMAGINPYEFIIRRLKESGDYDYIIMDTRPSIEPDIKPVLIASDNIIVPILTGIKSIEGGNRTIEFVMNIQLLKPEIKITGIFFNRVNANTKSAKAFMPQAREMYGDAVLSTFIHQGEPVVRAENRQRPLTDVYPGSVPAKDFSRLLDEVVKRIG